MKFQLTFTVTYDAYLEDYDEGKTPAEMVDEDAAAAQQNPIQFMIAAYPYHCKVTGKVIEE